MQDDFFSPAARESDLAAMAGGVLDVLVIGGGITGAGVAYEAALRGLSVALVERNDYAAGTSSRSSKLIHGGVRYLQQGDIPLVLEAAEERRILRRIAPHLTRPRPMMFPTYGMGTHTKLNVGLWTYEKLARIPDGERHRMLDREEALAREPGLRPEGLTGAAVYPENLTDDAWLVLAVLQSAKRAGARVANHAEVVALSRDGNVTHAMARDRETDQSLRLRARTVVNAAGPWCDAVRALDGAQGDSRLHITKGIHFVVRHEDLPVGSMIVMQAVDRRPVFAIPRGEITYVGTTDTDYRSTAEYPEITRADVEYLLEAVRRTFPATQWGLERVVAAWAGLRPLVHEEGKRPSEISRKDEITVGPGGLISVAGGKLTTFRRMSEKVMEIVERQLGLRRGDSTSAKSPLEGGDLPQGMDVEPYAQVLVTRFGGQIPELVRIADRLVFHHGTGAARLLERAVESESGFLPGSLVLRSEIEHAVRGEMALRLTDVLERRLRLLLFDPRRGLDLAEEVADEMARLLGWSVERRARELDAYRATAAACLPVENSKEER